MTIAFKMRDNVESSNYTEMIEEIECIYLEDNKIEMVSFDKAYYVSDRYMDFCDFDDIKAELLKNKYIDFTKDGISFTQYYEEDCEDEGNTPENSNPPDPPYIIHFKS